MRPPANPPASSWGRARVIAGTEEIRGKNLAQALSEGGACRNRRQRVRFGARGVRGERRPVRRAPVVHVHGQDPDLRRPEHAVGRVRIVPPGEWLREGHARRADDAQHPPVSGVPVRHAARRMHGGERQSALHGARARAPALGLGRRDSRRRREFRAHGAGGRRKDQAAPRRRHDHRRAPGLQGHRRRHRDPPPEEDGPEVESAGFDQALRRARRRSAADARAGRARSRGRRVPAIHRRHDRRREGRRAAASEHRRQPAAGARVDPAVPRRQARSHHHAAAALPHLLADGELPHVHDARRREHPHPESPRHTRLRQGNGALQIHGVHRRQHAVQRARQQSRSSASSTSRRCG